MGGRFDRREPGTERLPAADAAPANPAAPVIQFSLTRYGPPSSEMLVAAFEIAQGVELPDAYRRFMLATNGGSPNPGQVFPLDDDNDSNTSIIDHFFSIGGRPTTFDLASVRGVFRRRVPAPLLPVARDYGGSLVCIGIEGTRMGIVYFWSMDDEQEEPTFANVWQIAADFDAFLAGLKPLD